MTPEELAEQGNGFSRSLLRVLALSAGEDLHPVPRSVRNEVFGIAKDDGLEELVDQFIDESSGELFFRPIEGHPEVFKNVFRILEACAVQKLFSPDELSNFPVSYEYFKTAIVHGKTTERYIRSNGVWRVMLTERDPTLGHTDRFDRDTQHHNREEKRLFDHRQRIARERLQRMGFPYSDTYEDYLRFITTNFSSMRFNGQTLTLEHIRSLLFPLIPNRPNFKRGHTYIVGRSGSGKSELLKTIYHLSKSSRIVIDPHGDLSRDIGSFSRESDYLIAPHKSPFTINPFAIDNITSSHRELVAQEITALIAELVEDSGLSRLMETIMFPIVYTLLACEYADFKMLSECINPNTGKEKLKALRPFVEPHHLTIWNELEGDTYDSSKQSVFNRLQSLLNYRLILNATSGEDDFGRAMKAVEGGGSIIISLPIPEIGEAVAVTLGRFFMTRLQIWAKARQSIPEEKRVPVLLLIDEFHNFLSHGTAETLDQFGRKFRLFMVLAHQHIQQLTDREVRGSILANTVNKIAGISNTETRNAIAREMLIEPDALEDLKVGTFVGRFGNSPPFTFRARMVPNGNARVNYFPSINGSQTIDGWRKLATSPPVQDFETSPNRQKQPNQEPPRTGAFKPKFDI